MLGRLALKPTTHGEMARYRPVRKIRPSANWASGVAAASSYLARNSMMSGCCSIPVIERRFMIPPLFLYIVARYDYTPSSAWLFTAGPEEVCIGHPGNLPSALNGAPSRSRSAVAPPRGPDASTDGGSARARSSSETARPGGHHGIGELVLCSRVC